MYRPLTQTVVAPPETQQSQQNMTVDASTHSTQSSRWKLSNFSFGAFGRAPVDPFTLGPRIIHLNNTPANNARKFMDNHVSRAKYNIGTFLHNFLLEQFIKYANLFILVTRITQ